jgi:mRNA (guanine-N7-)-methyltransferase
VHNIDVYINICIGIEKYVGVDIAKGSLQDFVDRINTRSSEKDRAKLYKLVCADMGSDDLQKSSLDTYLNANKEWKMCTPPLSAEETFDVASCQFAMHYMFQTRERAKYFFHNMSRQLKVGAAFIATTIDARVVAEAAHRVEFGIPHEVADSEADPVDRPLGSTDHEPHPKRCIRVMRDSEKVVMKLEFNQENWQRLFTLSGSDSPCDGNEAFGIRYNFTLDDGSVSVEEDAESAAVNAPEWLVPLGEPLCQLAREHNMELILCQNFQSFVFSVINGPNSADHMYGMRVLLAIF